MTNQPQTPMAQRSLQKIYFDHKDMDYYLSWILGRQVLDGSDQQECMTAAEKIIDGDPKSWQRVWVELASDVEARAKEALARGEKDEARKSFLRACTYYRSPLFMMDPKTSAFRECVEKQQACFQAAMPLSPFPIEAIEMEYQGKKAKGYSWRGGDQGKKFPTLLIVGGMETFAEDCYFITGQLAIERGYNMIAIDLPGQGMNPDQGLFLEANMKPPVSALIDYALSRSDVDPQQIALFGFSWGGHIVLQGAEGEPRLKALVANPPMPDVFKAAAAQQSGNGRSDPINVLVFEQLAWRFGLQISAIGPRLVKAFQYLVHGKANCKKITCPTLCMAGEGEAKITLDLANKCFNQMPNPKNRLTILTAKEGGEAHCQVNNLPLLNKVILDWLEMVI